MATNDTSAPRQAGDPDDLFTIQANQLQLSIDITKPLNNSVVGPTITVTGTVRCDLFVDRLNEQDQFPSIGSVTKVEVRFGTGAFVLANPTGSNGSWASWSFTAPAGTTPSLQITARATAVSHLAPSVTATHTITVQLDNVGPALTVKTPIEVSTPTPPPYTAMLSGTATDTPAGIDRVEWRVGSIGTFNPVSRSGNDWVASVKLGGLGTFSATVRAVDKIGNITTKTATIKVVDKTGPTLTIDSPGDASTVTWVDGGAPVTLRGSASDPQTGVAAVEWALAGQTQFNPATPVAANNWSSWSAEILLPAPGDQTVIVRARDKVGNETVRQRHLVVVLPFQPRDPLDVVSPAAYLDDLLGFVTRRVTTATGEAIDPARLAGAFHQPFGDLPDSTRRDVANEVVQQARIGVEVLRSRLALLGRTLAASDEAAYAQAAYLSLLNNLGVSYDELRLARVGDDSSRAALAERLGFALEETRPDALDRLTLRLDQVAEADLERLFGLVVTRPDPLADSTRTDSELLTLRRARLRALWREQDLALRSAPFGPAPILDPDLVATDDLRHPVAGNTAYNLWDERRQWIAGQLASLKARREAAGEPLAGFDAIVADDLGPLDGLQALLAAYREGSAIEAQLHALQLELPPFLYLMRFRDLLATATVLDDEWADIYSILTQVRKLRQFDAWRDEERQRNLTLGPDEFRLPAAAPTTSAPVALPRWRATEQARRAWIDTLHSRFDQDRLVAQALQTVVADTEAATLPLLRDALVAAIIPELDPAVAANRLTQDLAIDIDSSGSRRMARVYQAIETVQAVPFGLRTDRFPAGGTSPAAGWKLAFSPGYGEAEFDEEWRWMGTYATWRGAIFVFGYPENYLLPTLRPDARQTTAFKKWASDVRAYQQLTPALARSAAADYLTALGTQLVGALPVQLRTLTEQLTDAQLGARRAAIKQLFDAAQISDPRLAPTHWQEIFYFVPVFLALQLQKSGQYLAALDWLQTVYAYNLPVDQRKIYHGLKLEEQLPTEYHRAPDWLLEGLNPHDIVSVRANAYTRFTIMMLVRCFLEFADAEFTQDTAESIPRARALYVAALDLLALPEMRHAGGAEALFPPNPVAEALRVHAGLNLDKLRSGRNIAGIEREADLLVLPPGSFNGVPVVDPNGTQPLARPAVPRPTPYRYAVLIERAKQLVSIAQQIEASFLAALERRDAEAYSLIKARQDTQLARAGVRLQDMRVAEADGEVELARLQLDRSRFQVDHFAGLLDEGLTGQEQAAVGFMVAAAALHASAGVVSAVGSFFSLDPFAGSSSALSSLAAASSTTASIFQTLASYERRRQEWNFQRGLANHDLRIGSRHVVAAQDHTRIVRQERTIAQTQAGFAEETLDFLANKFTNAELYEWMSGILGGVYSYFLQQATAIAQLAQSQLAFERQELPQTFIRADYWQTTLDEAPGSGAAPDRRGLTGSARLLQDIFQLDQYAFATNRRKLQLTQTFSLAQLAPAEFQRFRETGRLVLATPMDLFDRAFPGHYLRLIKRVRTSVVALVPPAQGIRATLAASGISRVTVAGDIFQTAVIRRDPELVAFTSPTNATGLFELEPEGELLLPFEGMGVDTTWELQMPRASNPFDFGTIADVLLTVEYTALHSSTYRQQVIKGLDRAFSADRPWSFRQQFADQWYDLHNPEQSATPMVVRFETRRADFPPNVEDLTIRQVLLYVARSNGATFELPVIHLRFTGQGDDEAVGGSATTVDGIISTRRANGVSWLPIAGGRPPVGIWELALPDTPELRARFQQEQIDDILFVITYDGRTPEWPA